MPNFTPIASVSGQGAGVPRITDYGANLILVYATKHNGGRGFTENGNNTWTLLGTSVADGGGTEFQLWGCKNPNVGDHDFAGLAYSVSLSVTAFAAPAAFEFVPAPDGFQKTTPATAGTSVQLGTAVLSPEDGALIVVAAGSGLSAVMTSPAVSGYAAGTSNSGLLGEYGASFMTFLEQTTAVAARPTLTTANALRPALCAAVIRPGTTFIPPPPLPSGTVTSCTAVGTTLSVEVATANADSGTVTWPAASPANGAQAVGPVTLAFSGATATASRANVRAGNYAIPVVSLTGSGGSAAAGGGTALEILGLDGQPTAPNTDGSTSTEPGAPTIGQAVAGVLSASFAFTPPVSNGGSAILDYTVTTSGGQTATGTSSPITVSGMPANVAQTAVVRARNAVGVSPASAASNAVTPTPATAPPPAPPSAPVLVGAITTSGVTQTAITMAYPAATDAVGVTGYEVSKDGGATWLQNALLLTFTFSGLTAATAYQLRVRAKNAAALYSATLALAQTTAAVTPTPAPPPTGGRLLSSRLERNNRLPHVNKSFVCFVHDDATGALLVSRAVTSNSLGLVDFQDAALSAGVVYAVRFKREDLPEEQGLELIRAV